MVETLTEDVNGFLQSSAGVITLDKITTSLTIKSSNFSSALDSFSMRAYWFIKSPSDSRIVVSYDSIQPGQSTYFNVYEILNLTELMIAGFTDVSPAPGYTVFSGNEAMFVFDRWSYSSVGGEGIVFQLNATGRPMLSYISF